MKDLVLAWHFLMVLNYNRCCSYGSNYISMCVLPQSFFSEARWDDLVQQFRQENFRLHQLNSTVFTAALQAGLSSLKTPYPFCLLSIDCGSLFCLHVVKPLFQEHPKTQAEVVVKDCSFGSMITQNKQKLVLENCCYIVTLNINQKLGLEKCCYIVTLNSK